jgi:hypothetical protein
MKVSCVFGNRAKYDCEMLWFSCALSIASRSPTYGETVHEYEEQGLWG